MPHPQFRRPSTLLPTPLSRSILTSALAVAALQLAPSVNAQSASPAQLTEIVVETDAPADSYTATYAETATRTDTPIAKTPLSIQVVPRQVIEDQNVTRLKDVYRNVSGVVPQRTEGFGLQFENAYIRGFSQLLTVDEVNLYTVPPLNLAGIERVEILKGPASSLYGAVEPGGLINVLPKQASFLRRSEIYGEYGTDDFYRAGFDTAGPLGDNVAFRVVGDFLDSGSFRDFLHTRSIFFSPSLAWKISEQTRLTTWLWYQHLERPYDNGVVFTFDGIPVGPISRNLAGPNHNEQTIDDLAYSMQLEHDLTPDLTIRGKFMVHNFEGDMDAIRWSGVSAANTISPYYDASSFHNWQFNFILDATWRFEIGSTRHQIVVGADLNRNDYYYKRNTANLAPIDIFHPTAPSGTMHLMPGVATQHTLTQGVGGYLQEQMDAFDDRLHILLGGRVDYVDQHYRSWVNGNEFDQEDVGLTGRVGVLYDLTSWLSPYVNVCRSFNPNTAGSNLTFAGEPLDSTTGLQYEAGLKFSFFEKRLLLTAAAYRITKDNVAINDPAHIGFSLDGGRLRSQGVEVDLLGQITPEFQVIANYAYTDTEVLESTSLPVGASFLNIPEHAGSVWMKYTFSQGALKNFGAGVGVFASSAKAGDNNNTFDLPGYTRFDAGMWYTVELPAARKLKFQVNAFNLFDKKYYESSSSAGNVQPGTPFSIIAKCSVTF